MSSQHVCMTHILQLKSSSYLLVLWQYGTSCQCLLRLQHSLKNCGMLYSCSMEGWLLTWCISLKIAKGQYLCTIKWRDFTEDAMTWQTSRRDRDNKTFYGETETRDPSVRDETETMTILIETRPRRDADTSRDRLETETSRPRLHVSSRNNLWRQSLS